MGEMRQAPVNMTQEELLAVLADITDRVRGGDSFEGSLTYAIAEDPAADPHSFDVLASYRIGNSLSQGGVRMIGEWAAEVCQMTSEEIQAKLSFHAELGIIEYVTANEAPGAQWLVGVNGQVIALHGQADALAWLAAVDAMISLLDREMNGKGDWTVSLYWLIRAMKH